MEVSEPLEEASSNSPPGGMSQEPPGGRVSADRKHRARSHEDYPFPKQKREPSGCSVFNMTLLPFSCVTGILHGLLLKESNFLLLTLKKKKPFYSSHTACLS